MCWQDPGQCGNTISSSRLEGEGSSRAADISPLLCETDFRTGFGGFSPGIPVANPSLR